MHLTGLGLLAIAAVLGCSDPAGPRFQDIVLTPDRATYAPGQSVSADLFNGTNIDIGLGLCDLRLEQKVGSHWRLVGPPALPCLDPLIVVRPGVRFAQMLELEPDLAAGTYRLRQEIMPYTSLPARFVRSQSFLVESAGP